MPYEKYQCKGIVIFGLPASGKTTFGRALVKALPESRFVEAADLTIRAIASLRQLPASLEHLTSLLINSRRLRINLSRVDARKLSLKLQKKYSRFWMGKLVARLHEQKYPKEFLIIAGARGFENAVFLGKQGYLIVYVKASRKKIITRLMARDEIPYAKALYELKDEERLFKTQKIENLADVVITAKANFRKSAEIIKRFTRAQECKKCVNTTQNPSTLFNKQGLCHICAAYKSNLKPAAFKDELTFFKSFVGKGRKYDCLVGTSGGKDSTATLYSVKQMGFRPLVFTFDLGYYPAHIFPRAKKVAKELGVDYQKIDIRKYIRPIDRVSYKLTADLYDEPDSLELQKKFRKFYQDGRKHYSVKCKHAFPFVRTCQLCRRIVIRAHWHEAVKRGIKVVVLGMNEWAGLAKNQFSAIRKLKPFKNKPAVYIIHLPFLLGRKVGDTRKILSKLGWRVPRGERLVESNANSCLLARAAENKARHLLGFHPDSTRLAREVTVDFITKKQAHKALNKIHNYQFSVRQVLQRAKIL